MPLDSPLLLSAHRVLSRYQLSWWESLVIAAAETAGCGTLYSEDLQDGQKYFSVEVCNPFRAYCSRSG